MRQRFKAWRQRRWIKRMVKREAKRIKREGNTRHRVLAAHLWHATRLTALD